MTPPDERAGTPLDLDAIEADLGAIEAHLAQLDEQPGDEPPDAEPADDAQSDDQLAGADPARP